MVSRLVIAFVTCLFVVGVAAQDPDQNRIGTQSGPARPDNAKNWKILSTDAWWVRVNAADTEARDIEWSFGKTDTNLNYAFMWTKRTTSPALGTADSRLYPGNMTLWLWEHLKPEPVVYVQAKAKPETASASFCVFYEQQGVALIEFQKETQEPVRIGRTDRETRCTP